LKGNIERQKRQAQRHIEFLSRNIGIEMVAIPGGNFMMGSPQNEPERNHNEGPQHVVRVPEFLMGRYPVTQAQWNIVADKMPSVNQKLNANPSRFRGEKRPVEQVSWYDAMEFCDRLSSHAGRDYRLPSEAEWEYACRAGTTTPFYYGPTVTPKLANYYHEYSYNGGPTGKSSHQTTPVGQYRYPNVWGLSDMHGNVWEWCTDQWRGNYDGVWDDSLEDKESGRIYSGKTSTRGGSWSQHPKYCRSAYRSFSYDTVRNYDLGFRVVCVLTRTSG
jgi:formylglycine-generating enzyme required for sulfatase activity